MALYGADISNHQPTLLGKDFIIIKATEGTTFVDPTCDDKYQANKAAGKLLGVYHFASFTDAVAEANYFVDNIQGYLGEALLALDVETNSNVGWALAWLNQVYARTQVRPSVYMSAFVCTVVDWTMVYDAGYSLWVAGYPAAFDVANPPTPQVSGADMPYDTGAWPFATIWQYTSSAGNLDRDIFYGTADGWHKLAQGDRNNTAQSAPGSSTTQDPQPTTPVPTDPVPSDPVVQPTPSTVPETTQPTPGTPTDPTQTGTGTQPPPVETQPTSVATPTTLDTVVRFLSVHFPYVIGIALILLNTLVDNKIINFSDQLTNVLNAILAAAGLGVLHHRQNS